jgi:hypothetical protein
MIQAGGHASKPNLTLRVPHPSRFSRGGWFVIEFLFFADEIGADQSFGHSLALIASMSMTGEMISPTISILPDIEPIQLLSSASGDAGTTSAIALPRRVTRSGVFVLLTSSSNDKHFALNLEIAISRIGFSFLFRIGILREVIQYTVLIRYNRRRIRLIPKNSCYNTAPRYSPSSRLFLFSWTARRRNWHAAYGLWSAHGLISNTPEGAKCSVFLVMT